MRRAAITTAAVALLQLIADECVEAIASVPDALRLIMLGLFHLVGKLSS